MITSKSRFGVSYPLFLGDASSGLAIFMGPQERMKQCLGAVFVGCFERFDHIGGLALQLGDVLENASHDLLVCRVPEPASRPRGRV